MSRGASALPPLVLLALTTFVFGGVGIAGARSAFYGEPSVDGWGTQWFYWFVTRQLALGEGFGWSDLLYYPWGKEIYLHTGGNFVDALGAAPLRAAFGPALGYNVWILALFVGNFLACRAVAKRIVADPMAAGVGAAWFAFNPYLLQELIQGRPTQVVCVFLLLFLDSFLGLADDRRWRRPVLAGFWLALTGLTYWYYAIFAGMLTAVLGAWWWMVPPSTESRARLFARESLAAGVSLLVCLPFILPMLAAGTVPGLLDVSTWTWKEWVPTTTEGVGVGIASFSPWDLATGGWTSPGEGKLEFRVDQRIVVDTELVFGFAGLLAVARRWRASLAVLLLASVWLAVGPALHIGREILPNPPYLLLVRASELFQRLWWPGRAIIVTHVVLAVLAAAAIARLPRAWLRVAVAIAGTAGLGYDLARTRRAPLHAWPDAIPAAYSCLRTAADGAVIELPFGFTQAHLYYQTAHGRPIFGGMAENNPVFAPAEHLAVRSGNSFFRVLQAVSALDDDTEHVAEHTPEDKQALRDLGFRYVLIDKDAYKGVDPGAVTDEERLRYARRRLVATLGPPVFDDAQSAIYAPWGDPCPCPGMPGARRSAPR